MKKHVIKRYITSNIAMLLSITMCASPLTAININAASFSSEAVSANSLDVEELTKVGESNETPVELEGPIGGTILKQQISDIFDNSFGEMIELKEGNKFEQAFRTVYVPGEKENEIVPADGYLLTAVKIKTDATSESYFYKFNFVNRTIASEADLRFYLFDENKLYSTLDPNYTEGNYVGEATEVNTVLKLDSGKTYYIVASMLNNKEPRGSINLSYEKILDDVEDSYDSAYNLQLDKEYANKMNGYNDVDWFKFKTSNKPAFYNLWILNKTVKNDLKFSIYNSSLQLIVNDETFRTGKSYEKTLTLEPNSTYYIRVNVNSPGNKGGDMDNVGDYTLKIHPKYDEFTDTMSTAKEIFINNEYTGEFQSDEDYDRLTFMSRNLSAYCIAIKNLNTAGKIKCEIKDSFDTTVKTINLNDGINQVSKLSLDANSRYYILLSGTEDVQYSIIITPSTHKLTYVLNGGKNNPKNKDTFIETDTTKLYSPTRKGYVFDGWYRKKDFKADSKVESIGKKSETEYDTQDVTLYAKWIKIDIEKVNIKSVKVKSKRNIVVKFENIGKKIEAENKEAKENAEKYGFSAPAEKKSIVQGYEVQCSTSKKFKNAKKVKLNSKKSSTTIKKLKKNKTYYVRVRAYTTDSTNNKIYSKWSKTMKVKTKK